MRTVCARLVKSLNGAAIYNPDVQVAPACILWPDRDRQWEAIIPRIQVEIPDFSFWAITIWRHGPDLPFGFDVY